MARTPRFDGDTYDHDRDHDRLVAQLAAVRMLMRDGAWRTLAEISETVGHPPASVSARLRDLRKSKFGAFIIDRQYVARGLFRYRMRVPAPPPAPVMPADQPSLLAPLDGAVRRW